MINIILGPPGGGKSYEAVVFHVLEALKAGRKVITNLPLELEWLKARGYPVELVEIRTETRAERPQVDWAKAESMFKRFGIAAQTKYFNNAAFANLADYGDTWRHPETGSGPLYVIDECHIPLPRNGTPLDVEHWFSLHRHESADVLLLTQSVGKINRSIQDLVQVCYRVKKATALGSNNRYIRKVVDGVRGEVTNENIRVYDSKFFGSYRSHTRGGGAELAAADIKPIWQHWTFKGAAICFAIVLTMGLTGNLGNPFKAKIKEQPGAVAMAAPSESPTQSSIAGPSLPVSPSQSKEVPTDKPFGDLVIHVAGHITASDDKKHFVYFYLSQNGQRLKMLSDKELINSGYRVVFHSDCDVELQHDRYPRRATCDMPAVSPVAGSSAPSVTPSPAPVVQSSSSADA